MVIVPEDSEFPTLYKLTYDDGGVGDDEDDDDDDDFQIQKGKVKPRITENKTNFHCVVCFSFGKCYLCQARSFLCGEKFCPIGIRSFHGAHLSAGQLPDRRTKCVRDNNCRFRRRLQTRNTSFCV